MKQVPHHTHHIFFEESFSVYLFILLVRMLFVVTTVVSLFCNRWKELLSVAFFSPSREKSSVVYDLRIMFSRGT